MATAMNRVVSSSSASLSHIENQFIQTYFLYYYFIQRTIASPSAPATSHQSHLVVFHLHFDLSAFLFISSATTRKQLSKHTHRTHRTHTHRQPNQLSTKMEHQPANGLRSKEREKQKANEKTPFRIFYVCQPNVLCTLHAHEEPQERWGKNPSYIL